MPVASRSGAVWCLKKVQALVQWAQTAVRGALRRASRREWSCACLWWCERRVAGAGGAGRPWGASTGQSHMAQLRIGAARVCVRAGTYVWFSRGVRGEGHEGRRPRVYWRVRVRGARRREGARRQGGVLRLAKRDLKKNLSVSFNNPKKEHYNRSHSAPQPGLLHEYMAPYGTRCLKYEGF